LTKRNIDEISDSEKSELKNILKNMRSLHEQLREILFVIDDDRDAIAEKLHDTDALESVFELWIKGESLDYIGEAVFQDDGESIRKIFESIGMTDFE